MMVHSNLNVFEDFVKYLRDTANHAADIVRTNRDGFDVFRRDNVSYGDWETPAWYRVNCSDFVAQLNKAEALLETLGHCADRMSAIITTVRDYEYTVDLHKTEPAARYFVFDEDGSAHETTKDQYLAITPEDDDGTEGN